MSSVEVNNHNIVLNWIMEECSQILKFEDKISLIIH